MTDALSAIARDGEREDAYETYLHALLDYLRTKKPSHEKFKKLETAAKSCDAVRGGYWGPGRTTLSKNLEERTKKLYEREKAAWCKLLSSLIKNQEMYRAFKNISPFKEKMLILVDYGCGFVNIEGDIEKFLADIIRAKRMRVYDADKYFVELPTIDAKKVSVHWIRCGIVGITGARIDVKKPA